MRLIRAEELPRVGLEHHDTRRLPGCAAPLQRFEQERLMAAMDAIEIADGEHAAKNFGRHVPVAVDNAHTVPVVQSETALSLAASHSRQHGIWKGC